jgi:hypothetical protein
MLERHVEGEPPEFAELRKKLFEFLDISRKTRKNVILKQNATGVATKKNTIHKETDDEKQKEREREQEASDGAC